MWLARKFTATLRHTPKDQWGTKLSTHQAFRLNRKGLERIERAVLEQYHHLRSYAEEFRSSLKSIAQL